MPKNLEEGTLFIGEGVFDGISDVNSNGCSYKVPDNYISKTMLVEGDIMAVYVKKNGSYMFKLIRKAQRKYFDAKYVGNGQVVSVNEKKESVYRIVHTSEMYFDLVYGDLVYCVSNLTGSFYASVINLVCVVEEKKPNEARGRVDKSKGLFGRAINFIKKLI